MIRATLMVSLKCTIRVYTYDAIRTYSECIHKPHTYMYTPDSAWTPRHNHYTTFTTTTLDILPGHVNVENETTLQWLPPINIMGNECVHTHITCQECVPGSKVYLCTGPIWTYKKPYLEPPIPLRVRHVGTNNHPVATLDRVGTAKWLIKYKFANAIGWLTEHVSICSYPMHTSTDMQWPWEACSN